MSRQLHLNAFLMGVGHHEAAWRHPRTAAHRVLEVEHFQELGRIAERGKLDSVFFADGLAVGPRVEHNIMAVFEPVTLLSAIAVATRHVGLIATASTTYSDPYTLARKFASLDHISRGRAGWNIVTSAGADEAANFGLDAVPAHEGRYARADEFLDVTLALWDSWEPDSVLLDADRGTFADPTRVHTDRTRRTALPGARPAELAALAAGPAAAGAGGVVGIRQGLRRPLRRGGVHRAAHPRRGPAVLPRPEGAGGGRGPQRGRIAGAAGDRAVHRGHAGAGPGAGAVLHRPDLAGVFAASALDHGRRRPHRVLTGRAAAGLAAHRADPGQQESLSTCEGPRRGR